MCFVVDNETKSITRSCSPSLSNRLTKTLASLVMKNNGCTAQSLGPFIVVCSGGDVEDNAQIRMNRGIMNPIIPSMKFIQWNG